MDLIIAIFMWLGMIAPGETPTQEMIDNNQPVIQSTEHDPAFQDYYQTTYAETITTMNISDGD